MLRRKRYPVTKSGVVVTPEVAERMAEEAEEDLDPADFVPRVVKQPWVGPQSLSSRIDMHLRDFGDAVKWKVEDGVHAVGKIADGIRRHVKA